jgi:imidazolonepropionase
MLELGGGRGKLSTILIRGARQLLTLRGGKSPRRGADLRELHLITDGSLLIRDGLIHEVGPTRRVENLGEARNAIEINAAGRVVMPGFVDSHTHLVFPGPGISDSQRDTALRHLRACSGNLLRRRAHRSLETMVRHGTTTVEAKTGLGLDLTSETKILRVLTSLKRTPVDLLTAFLSGPPSEDRSADCRLSCPCCAGLARVRRRGSAGTADWAWTATARNRQHCADFYQCAREFGLTCKMHADTQDCAGAVAAAVANNVLSIDHLEQASAGDAALLAASSVIATLLPAASFRCGGRFAPARAFVEAGAAVSLATDFSPHQASTLNMQTVISLACTQMGLTPEEAVTAATFNAAHAAASADRVGSLEPGKKADVLILNTSDFRELAHHLGTNLVHLTMKSGQFIYQEGAVAPKAEEDLSAA